MRFSNLITSIISAAFVVHQASCVAVHNGWVVPEDFGDITEMISSIRVPKGSDPEGSYWMANGFNRGYMGMQHNFGVERRILFSIWDNGQKSIVNLAEKGEGALVEGFGGEGTGAHAIIHYDWKTEDTVYFKVTANPDFEQNAGIFSGHYSTDGGQNWNLVATFIAEQQPIYLTGLYGFLEDYPGTRVMREGYYGNFTIKNTEGRTAQITDFSFTHTDPYDERDYWEQKQHLGPNNEVYMRIEGNKEEGIYSPPSNPQ